MTLFWLTSYWLALPGAAQTPQRYVEVTETGRLDVTSDLATISLELTNYGKDVGTAKAINDRRLAAMIKTLTEHAVPRQAIRIESLSVEDESHWDWKKKDEPYLAERSITIRVRDLDKIDSILAALEAMGVTDVERVSFRLANAEQYESKVLELAMKQAQAKAERLARLGNLELGPPISIREHGGWGWGGFGGGGGGAGGSGPTGAKTRAIPRNTQNAVHWLTTTTAGPVVSTADLAATATASSSTRSGAWSYENGTTRVSSTVTVKFELRVPNSK